MKKNLFLMVLILGIYTSFSADAHGPPDHTEQLKAQKEAVMTYTAVEDAFVYATTSPQVEVGLAQVEEGCTLLSPPLEQVDGNIVVQKSLSGHYRDHYMMGRSRLRSC